MKMNLNEKYLANMCVFSVCMLLVVWVIPETIALRHCLLILGFIVSGLIIKKNIQSLYPIRASNLSIYILFSIFIWVGIHWTFFSLDTELELSEIQSLWVRTFLGCVMGVGLGVSLRKYAQLARYFYVSIFATPLINLGAYGFDCFRQGSLVLPNNFVRFLFTKIETAYFGGMATAVASGNLIYLLTLNGNRQVVRRMVYWVFGIALMLASAIVSSTKNGMIIILVICLTLVIIFGVSVLKNYSKNQFIRISILTLIIFFICTSWSVHKRYASPGWQDLLYDIQVAVDIDNNKQWMKAEGAPTYPLNALGHPIAINTYSRVAWATAGLRLIGQYPLGYGSINRSFNGIQNVAGIAHEHIGQTHSGWVDYGLAFGVPGLSILISALLLTIYFGLKNKDQLNLVAVSICGALFVFCIFAEMSWKQYFESMLFFIAFSTAVVGYRKLDGGATGVVKN